MNFSEHIPNVNQCMTVFAELMFIQHQLSGRCNSRGYGIQEWKLAIVPGILVLTQGRREILEGRL